MLNLVERLPLLCMSSEALRLWLLLSAAMSLIYALSICGIDMPTVLGLCV